MQLALQGFLKQSIADYASVKAPNRNCKSSSKMKIYKNVPKRLYFNVRPTY